MGELVLVAQLNYKRRQRFRSKSLERIAVREEDLGHAFGLARVLRNRLTFRAGHKYSNVAADLLGCCQGIAGERQQSLVIVLRNH